MSISLEAAIRTCKVDTAWANKIESDRFLNPNNMVCPIWNGVDTAGRSIHPDSFYTKTAGCNSAEDRVMVENNVSRPQYMEYINLSANGIDGNIYGNTMGYSESGERTAALNQIHNITGQFGQVTGFGQNILPNCGDGQGAGGMWQGKYNTAMAQETQAMRQVQYANNGMLSNQYRKQSGY